MLKVIRWTSLCLAALLIAGSAAAQSPAEIAAQIKNSANPELIGALTKGMGGSVAQATGAAGTLLGFAKTKLKPEDFTKLAGAVPGMDSLLSAAPAVVGTSGAAAVGGATSALGGLSSLAPAFDKLGIKPEMA